MATRKSAAKTVGKRVKKEFKSKVLPNLVPGAGIVKGVKALTTAEKSFRRKLKSSIRERIEDREIRTGLESRNPKMVKAKKAAESRSRKSLRSDVRNLGKIVGEKEAAKFTQAKRATVRGVGSKPSLKNPSRAKPRARK